MIFWKVKDRIMNSKLILLLIFIVAIFMVSCKKSIEFYTEPYGEPKQTIGVEFDRTFLPIPNIGKPGDEVVFKVSGLHKFKDQAVFKMNDEIAETISISDKEVKVRVPPFASSGVASLIIGDVILFGPNFQVIGPMKVDPTWAARIGANGSVHNMLSTQDEKNVFIGDFTNYENKGSVRPINRLVRTFRNGSYDVGWRTGKGANGMLNDIIRIDDRYYISGSFSGYDQRGDNISNMTSLHIHGMVDTMGIKPFRRFGKADTLKYYPVFNGGFNSSVDALYEDNGKIIVAGNFRYHISRQYDKPNYMQTQDTIILDSTEIRQIARLNLDGSLDKGFRFSGGKALTGANGNINTYRHESGPLKGKIVVYGFFTRFDDKKVGYVTRLNSDGTVDDTFNTLGAGADYYIYSLSYNVVTDRYILAGNFKTFNGVKSEKMVMLNNDGSIDNSFVPRAFDSDYPSFVQQLDDGLIIVNGGFSQYAGVARQRFMVLNPDGTLHPELNTTGRFEGTLYKVIETKAEDGKRALLLMGSFWKFDNQDYSNVLRIIIE